jgi:xylose dehydrogenase (NAD/NADP)
MPKARLGQIGVGGYGVAIRSAILAADNAELVAVADRNGELCRRAAAETGARALSVDELFAADDVQGVVIVVPDHLHRQFVLRAAAVGKPVFVEKPIAGTLADGAAMVQACRDAGVPLMVGHNYRRQPAFRQLKRWLDEGAVGRVVDGQAQASTFTGLSLTADKWRFDPDLCPALPLVQLGIHLIDICNWLFGEPLEVTSRMRHRAIPGENVDASMTLIEYPDDVLVTLASHYCTPVRTELTVTGVEGVIKAERTCIELARGHRGEDKRVLEVGFGDSQREQMHEFAAAILNGEPLETPGEVGLWALAVCEAARLSQDERRSVLLAELPAWRGVVTPHADRAHSGN